ncbi:helix-turn-helix transcriptional regulator [Streptomyces olivaceus]|uniref:helix-turn-helix transcriptional regulator n=1 Tax=Streptomyces olivaceus TaxID=47716 RepID=UPI001CCA87D2|nr:helix-turn-helix transcriptional regulator [Streptomyces olivaceus]MBZ6248041.1 helix-turn-helix transcriptional regulator [Streptomyces olivaceus]
MHGHRELGAFLQTLRARLRPEDVGLPDYGDRRRVPGLRREELSLLAGVSSSYYTRLEQGQSLGASPEVLDALARALRLDEAERRHLHDLAGSVRRRPVVRRPPEEHADAATLDLLDALDAVPALVSGRRGDILAWNPLGHALFASHLDHFAPQCPDDRPNLARLIFLDDHVRALYTDWPGKARAVVRNLRMVAGRHPDDGRLGSLIGELTMSSPEFASMWAEHGVSPCDSDVWEMHHPLVGVLTVNQQSLRPPQDGDSLLVLATAARGDSASRSALSLLAQVISDARGCDRRTQHDAGEGRRDTASLPGRADL